MNKTVYNLLALALLMCTTATAQEVKKDKNVDKKEIVIQEKSSGKNEKMVIVVDGDKMTINGRPAEEYKGKKRIVIDNDIRINGDEIHVPRAADVFVNGFNNRALLGVVTENNDKGAQVKELIDESAAAKAGLQEGDIITSFNGAAVKNHGDLVKGVGKLAPGEEADITYLRDGKEKKVKAKLGKSKAPMMAWNYDGGDNFNFKMDPPVAMVGPRAPRAPFSFNEDDNDDMWVFRDDRPRYGMSIEDNADGDGVKVTGIEEDSNAFKAGLKDDDVITEADGKAVKSLDDLKEVLKDTKDKTAISLKVLRGGNTENITLKVPKVIKKADL